MSEATPEQARAALEWQAQEAAAQRGVDAQVAAMQQPPDAPAATPEQQQQAEQAKVLTAVVAQHLPKACAVAWVVVDRLVQQLAGSEFALTKEEISQLAEATGPVVEKYMPASMDWLVKTPEGVLCLTAGMIYASKALTPSTQPASSPAPAPEATA